MKWAPFMLFDSHEEVMLTTTDGADRYLGRQEEVPKGTFPLCKKAGWDDYAVVKGRARVELGGGLVAIVAPAYEHDADPWGLGKAPFVNEEERP